MPFDFLTKKAFSTLGYVPLEILNMQVDQGASAKLLSNSSSIEIGEIRYQSGQS